MERLLFKLASTVWGRNLVYLMLLVFVSAIALQWRENQRVNELRSQEAREYRKELLDERAKFDARLEAQIERHISSLNAANERQAELLRQIERIKKRIK